MGVMNITNLTAALLGRWKMNKKECIDDLNYIRKALTKGSLYQHDAIILLIDTLTEYLLVEDEKAARHE